MSCLTSAQVASAQPVAHVKRKAHKASETAPDENYLFRSEGARLHPRNGRTGGQRPSGIHQRRLGDFVLRNQVQGRLRLNDSERKSLAEIGIRLGREALGEVADEVRTNRLRSEAAAQAIKEALEAEQLATPAEIVALRVSGGKFRNSTRQSGTYALSVPV